MTVETQLRALADATRTDQHPVTADEAISRALEHDRPESPARPPYWLLIAATIVVLVGGLVVLFARDQAADDEQLPGVSIPATVPDTAAPITEVLVNEPTLEYRDGIEWWVPSVLPDGWRYGYAVDDGNLQTVSLLADDGATIDVVLERDPDASDDVVSDVTSEDLGGVLWDVADADGAATAVRVVDGKRLAVSGPIEAVRSVAAALDLVPETDLVRPPFHDDDGPGPVVLTLPADEVAGSEPFELHAHTDGLFTTVGGEIKQVSSSDPLAFGDYVYELTGDAESYPVVATGIALEGADPITFGLPDGNAIEVSTVESDRFAERFYAFVIDVPAALLEAHDRGAVERLTRWTYTFVDGEQLVYDEPASESCVNCDGDVVDTPTPSGPASASALVFEPTNVPSDDLWLMPTTVPDGLSFDYAEVTELGDDRTGQSIRYRGESDRDEGLWVWTSPFADSDPGLDPSITTTPVIIDGAGWSWEDIGPVRAGGPPRGTLRGFVEGRSVEITGELDTATAVAETLELVPGSQLPRPPFSNDPASKVVVARLSGSVAAVERASEWAPSELSAATDGASILFQGGPPTAVAAAQPVVFSGATSGAFDTGADFDVIVVSGFALAEVATLEFEQLLADAITIRPEDLSGRIGLGFFHVAIVVPPGGYDAYASLVPSVTARDADGNVITVVSEPF
jgi:hypothetical protein